MQEEFFKIIGILIVISFCLYIAVKSLKLQTSIVEGLTNSTSESSKNADFSVGNSSSNVENYSTKISAEQLKIKDMLNVDKYRQDYENLIIKLDDYIGALMTKEILNINSADITEDSFLEMIKKLNELNLGRESLNTTMKFIDGLK